MARKGRGFELAYKHLYDLLDKDIYTVTSPAFPIDKTTGKGREVDVLIEFTDVNGNPRRISIECRDRSKVQDITWIEQLVQKKEDLDLDYTIATTTTSFSDGAIAKANYHGILIEEAEMPSVETINKLQSSTFVDFFFFKFELLECSFFIEPNGFVPLRSYLKQLNIIDQSALIKELNTELLLSFDPHELIKQHPDALDFFSAEDNCLVLEGTTLLTDKKPECLKQAHSIKYKVKVVPRKVSLPISDSFAVFSTEDHSNKKYRADFKSDIDYFAIGYLDGKLIVDFGIKKRRFWRLASGTMHLNTIIPDGVEFETDKYIEKIMKEHLGEFDLSQVI